MSHNPSWTREQKLTLIGTILAVIGIFCTVYGLETKNFVNTYTGKLLGGILNDDHKILQELEDEANKQIINARNECEHPPTSSQGITCLEAQTSNLRTIYDVYKNGDKGMQISVDIDIRKEAQAECQILLVFMGKSKKELKAINPEYSVSIPELVASTPEKPTQRSFAGSSFLITPTTDNAHYRDISFFVPYKALEENLGLYVLLIFDVKNRKANILAVKLFVFN